MKGLITLILVFLIIPFIRIQAQPGSEKFSKIKKNVVLLRLYDEPNYNDGNPFGHGIIVNNVGSDSVDAVTAFHVLEKWSKFDAQEALFNNNTKSGVKLISSDKNQDLMIVRLKKPDKYFSKKEIQPFQYFAKKKVKVKNYRNGVYFIGNNKPWGTPITPGQLLPSTNKFEVLWEDEEADRGGSGGPTIYKNEIIGMYQKEVGKHQVSLSSTTVRKLYSKVAKENHLLPQYVPQISYYFGFSNATSLNEPADNVISNFRKGNDGAIGYSHGFSIDFLNSMKVVGFGYSQRFYKVFTPRVLINEDTTQRFIYEGSIFSSKVILTGSYFSSNESLKLSIGLGLVRNNILVEINDNPQSPLSEFTGNLPKRWVLFLPIEMEAGYRLTPNLDLNFLLNFGSSFEAVGIETDFKPSEGYLLLWQFGIALNYSISKRLKKY